MDIVYTEAHRRQDGKSELIDGQLKACFEMPRRADLVLARVRETGIGEVLDPVAHGLAPILAVHTEPFVTFLETAWGMWVAEHGNYDALPLLWVTRTLRQDRIPAAIDGKLSYFAIDAGTPITGGTWDAITAGVDVGLTASDLIQSGRSQGAFALSRPPGHHAAADLYGGYCFFNNAAIAAQYLRSNGASRVGILDVDYHHGNGTQSIFYSRSDVVFASIHADPAQEYPYFLGFSDETGQGNGDGANLNIPLRWGTDWSTYEPALRYAGQWLANHRIDALVVSLGVDTYEGDPISQFRLVSDDYLRMGATVRDLGIPTVFIFEGGYAVEAIGVNVVNVLTGFDDT